MSFRTNTLGSLSSVERAVKFLIFLVTVFSSPMSALAQQSALATFPRIKDHRRRHSD